MLHRADLISVPVFSSTIRTASFPCAEEQEACEPHPCSSALAGATMPIFSIIFGNLMNSFGQNLDNPSALQDAVRSDQDRSTTWPKPRRCWTFALRVRVVWGVCSQVVSTCVPGGACGA